MTSHEEQVFTSAYIDLVAKGMELPRNDVEQMILYYFAINYSAPHEAKIALADIRHQWPQRKPRHTPGSSVLQPD